MSILRNLLLPAILAAAPLLTPCAARAQIVLNEPGFSSTLLSGDVAKQIELGIGPDTCLYYGSFEGLRRRCAPTDTGTICDPSLTFPVGIAFSTGGSFGSAMYVADYAAGNIHRSTGCSVSTVFATIGGPGSIAFPPSGSAYSGSDYSGTAYGDYLYACVAFSGPIYRVNSAGTLTSWLALPTAYLKFGPGGAWGTGMYATDYSFSVSGASGIVRVSSAGAVTALVSGITNPEGFDWGFDGDLFATDVQSGQILRVKSNGTATLFATLGGAADVAWRPGESALYVVSNQGGLYRITRGTATGVVDDPPAANEVLSVSPNPARGACVLSFVQRVAGLARANVVDAQGRLVRRLPEAWRPAGGHSLAWDGRDDAGARVHPGAYFLRVVVAGEMRSARVTIMH